MVNSIILTKAKWIKQSESRQEHSHDQWWEREITSISQRITKSSISTVNSIAEVWWVLSLLSGCIGSLSLSFLDVLWSIWLHSLGFLLRRVIHFISLGVGVWVWCSSLVLTLASLLICSSLGGWWCSNLGRDLASLLRLDLFLLGHSF